METLRALRVLSTFRGSSWPVLVQTERQKLVVKLRGTAQGLRSLIAELVAGSLADALGLATPARYLLDLPADVPSDDPHQELGDLLERSQGLNLGLAYLEGFRDATPADAGRLKPELGAAIVWFDALLQNPDRTAKNVNLMIKAGSVRLIDHGAALAFHHDWGRVTEQTPREAGEVVAGHLLQVSEQQLLAADFELAPRLTRAVLEQALAEVPEDFLLAVDEASPARQRAAYVAFLWKRLRAPRPFVAGGRMLPFQLG